MVTACAEDAGRESWTPPCRSRNGTSSQGGQGGQAGQAGQVREGLTEGPYLGWGRWESHSGDSKCGYKKCTDVLGVF